MNRVHPYKDQPKHRITIIDEYDPESIAMLQAYYSRSPTSIVDRLDQLDGDTTKVKEAMKRVYIGYGHASVGDCGSTTIFIENVSQLAAKAFQDNDMYSGQESSTRYIDYKEQPFVSSDKHQEIYKREKQWLELYNDYLPAVKLGLSRKYPKQETEDEGVWQKAINARAFDIMRGLLPAGTCTQLSWHTNLRQARERLKLLVSHPLKEVRDIATNVLKDLIEKYPSSFKDTDVIPDEIVSNYAEAYFYPSNDIHQLYEPLVPIEQDYTSYFDMSGLHPIEGEALQLLQDRNQNTRLPKSLKALGKVRMRFDLDFGSWRDIQRHRNGVCPVPMLGAEGGLELETWYLREASDALKYVDIKKDKDVIPQSWKDQKTEAEIESMCQTSLDTYFESFLIIAEKATAKTWEDICKDNSLENRAVAQYMLPLATIVPCVLDYSLPQLIYVLELRSSQHVHSTLRTKMQEAATALMGAMENEASTIPWFPLFVDETEDRWSIDRGTQDIVEKE